ncbi:hypothetical protein BYT27DRAFT_7261761 [Phlegmacium glaucopus]|nr:hypothetical protein BYT27DRAFT_7261761 [Phlegmacium glaucopus]
MYFAAIMGSQFIDNILLQNNLTMHGRISRKTAQLCTEALSTPEKIRTTTASESSTPAVTVALRLYLKRSERALDSVFALSVDWWTVLEALDISICAEFDFHKGYLGTHFFDQFLPGEMVNLVRKGPRKGKKNAMNDDAKDNGEEDDKDEEEQPRKRQVLKSMEIVPEDD